MALNYHFDLYPRTNPLGARLVRFTNLQSAQFRGEANGTGSGEFTIRADDPEADFIDPLGLQYVRVVRDDDATELVIGGFFLERGEYKALDEDETKLLKFGGAGPLTIFQRAVMDADSWIDDPFIGTDPQPEGVWPLYLAGTGNELGAILWRVLHELEEPGRHQDPLPFTSLGFTHLVDSNAAAWVRTTGDFSAQVSESVLSIVRRLMQLGLYVEVDPNTFEVRAFEPETHRRDRTGVAWATDVVRFQAPTAGDILTGNIKSDATRALEAVVRRNAILTGSADTWLWVDDPGVTVPWEGGFVLDDDDGTSLLKAGEAQLALRGDAGDSLRLRMRLGDDEANGFYLPFEHVLLDDLVTVHTGTGQWDYNEAEFPVAALTISLRPGGDWDAWADLGSSYLSMAERAFQAQPLGAHNHPPNPRLCQPMTPPGAGDFVTGRFDSNTNPGDLSAWGDIEALPNAVLFIILHSGPTVDPSSIAVTCSDGRTAVEVAGSEIVNGDWGQIAYYVIDPANDMIITMTPNDGYHTYVLYQNVDQTNPVGSLLTASGTSATAALGAFDGFNSMWSHGGVGHATPNETTGQTELAGVGSQAFYNTEWGASAGIFGPAAPSWALSVSKLWSIIGISPRATGSGSSVGDGHAELIGTSIRAKRCDDTEHYHTTGDPTVNDDTTFGFRNNTLWINESTGAMFLLLDNADGAADWLAVGGGITDHGALTGLSDDDHPQYVKESEFTAVGDSLVGTGAGTFVKRKHNESASTAPTVNDDSGDGYAVGSHWLDLTAEKEYIALDVTVGAAVWKERTNVTGGGATIVVREVAGTDIEDVAEVEFDADDFVVSEPSAGIARVALAAPGGGGVSSPFWWHADNAPGGANDLEFNEGTVIGTLTRVAHGTPKGTWAEVNDGLEWTHTVSAVNELDVFAIPLTISVGDYVTLAASFPGYTPSALGSTVGFSNGTTFGTSNALAATTHLTGVTYRHLFNSRPGHNSLGTNSTFHDVGQADTVYGWRVKYEAANTWGFYVRSPGTGVWRAIQTNYAYTMTPTHVIFGIQAFNSPAFSAANGVGVRLECFRMND